MRKVIHIEIVVACKSVACKKIYIMLLLVTIIIVVVIVIVTTTIFCNTLPFETNHQMNFLLPLSIVFFLFKCGYVASRPKRITYPLFNFC